MTELQPFDDERVSAYLDGELSDSELAEFETLLAQRKDYARAVEELRTMRQAIRELPQHKLPENFAERVLHRAEREMLTGTVSREPPAAAPSRWAGNRWLAVGITALAACLLIMVGSQMRSGRPMEVASADKAERTDMAIADGAGEPLAEAQAGQLPAAAQQRGGERPERALGQPAGSAPGAQVVELEERAVADEMPPLSARVMDSSPAQQQLIEQARSWQQQSESLAYEWDIVVATQIRVPDDWRQMNTALVSNRLQLDAPPPRLTDRLAEADADLESFDDDFDAAAMNERLLRRLSESSSLASKSKNDRLRVKSIAPAPTPDTYVLYVEGTAEQLDGLVSQLPNTDQLVNIKSAREGYTAGARLQNAASREGLEVAEKVGRVQELEAASLPGRAANLGQSTLSEAMSPTVRRRAQQVSSAWRQAQRSQSSRHDEQADDRRFLRGVIILQDVSGSAGTESTGDPTGD